ncbi:hypothetical protein FY034_17505 (plasmid) [Trichlorobacter lovleyi]|uniref:hypothetical protein n=1 Tax=Trichlorobacter lovleyi TaxID=313985 RepID=UPI00223EEBAC|nr:hypothetical protein [Trichlorobacter lovleyi]QOX80820.1 hypothetical protein FY034_17505 [Trichlorobacter lovleyi]
MQLKQNSTPKFAEAQDILLRFRNANSEREKHKVIKSIQTKYPSIAARLKKVVQDGR